MDSLEFSLRIHSQLGSIWVFVYLHMSVEKRELNFHVVGMLKLNVLTAYAKN